MPFAALGLPGPITEGVRKAGYAQPTPIQREAIPLILPGHDLVAAAKTGSGKTAAFVLPILARLLEGPRALRALVLVPTRELAAQVEDCARGYAKFAPLRVGSVYGGVPIGAQERMIRNEGVDLLVATPGRLLDLQGRQSVALDEVEILVLDEADRMVDMGFAPDLKRILNLLPDDRQTLMFSATMPPALNDVAKKALVNPRRLDLAPPTRPAESIEQAIHEVPTHRKLDVLHRILLGARRSRTLVFVRTKHGADKVCRRLRTHGHRAAAIHGDRNQSQRERALRDFKRGRMNVLVATDIASRGIDVDGIEHVINYDVPRSPEDYVHRIGRTGRMEASGKALTLMSPGESKDISAIERSIGCKVPRVAVGMPGSRPITTGTTDAPRLSTRNGSSEPRSNGSSEPRRNGSSELRSNGSSEPRRNGSREVRRNGSTEAGRNGRRAFGRRSARSPVRTRGSRR